jgi:hypothetical protein
LQVKTHRPDPCAFWLVYGKIKMFVPSFKYFAYSQEQNVP